MANLLIPTSFSFESVYQILNLLKKKTCFKLVWI